MTLKQEFTTLDKLLLVKDNCRTKTGLDDMSLKALANDIEERGLRDAIKVRRVSPNATDATVIEDGQRRYLALCILAKQGRAEDLLQQIPVTVLDGADKTAETNDLEIHINGLLDNLMHTELSNWEVAEAVAYLRANGLDQKTIATRIKKSSSHVSQLLAAHDNAAPALTTAWRDDKLPNDIVLDIAKLPEDKQIFKVKEYLKATASGKRSAAGKARAAVKKKPNTSERPPIKEVQELLVNVIDAPKKNRYVAGMRDALRFCVGELGWAEFEKEYNDFVKDAQAAAKEK